MPEYKGGATGTGGRDGRLRSDTGSYEHRVVMPGARAEGVTPEEMLAGAWSACYGAAFLWIARRRGLDASSASFHSEVTLDSSPDKADITRATLEVSCPGIDDAAIAEIVEEAHGFCPVSRVFLEGVPDVSVSAVTSAGQGR